MSAIDNLDTQNIHDNHEERQNTAAPVNIDEIESQIDYLDQDLLDNIYTPGFYTIKLSNYDKEGNLLDDDIDEEQIHKQVQYATPTSITDMIDISKEPPILKKKFLKQKLVYCYPDGTIYYGNINVIPFTLQDGTTQYHIGPDGAGRLYKDKKKQYTGNFFQGKRTQGISHQPNGTKSVVNFHGNENLQKHSHQDLLMLFCPPEHENDYNDPLGFHQQSYSNIMINGKTTSARSENNKVENIKLEITNDALYNFSNKYTNFLDKDGHRRAYNPLDQSEPDIDIDTIVDSLLNTINECHNLKNIELSIQNNFAKTTNKNGQDVIQTITDKLSHTLAEKKINLFLSSPSEECALLPIHAEFASGEKVDIKTCEKYVYKKYNTATNSWETFTNQEEYNNALKTSGYYKHTTESQGDTCLGSNVFGQIQSLIKNDPIEQLRQNERLQTKKKLEELQRQRQAMGQTMMAKNTQVNTENKLTVGQKIAIGIAGILLPIAGGVIAYKLFTNNNNQQTRVKPSTVPQVNNQNMPQNTTISPQKPTDDHVVNNKVNSMELENKNILNYSNINLGNSKPKLQI